jgi:hypothetical protein
MLSRRSSNLRGDVTNAEQWKRISGKPNDPSVDEGAAHVSTTTASYTADGHIFSTSTVADDHTKSTSIENHYDAQTGQLHSYDFTGYRSDNTRYRTTVTYSYTFQNGQRVVSRIVDPHIGKTTKTYDEAGRLSSEEVSLPRPNGSGSDRFEKRSYTYSAQGRIIFKDIWLGLSSSGPECDEENSNHPPGCTVPLPNPSSGREVYVYAGNRLTATVGADRLRWGTKFDFAYTPMSEAASSGTSRYVVQSGDTLIDIAQAIYGDGALWYIIADRNSIAAAPDAPLDVSEVGKTYEIPSLIGSSNSASTFRPYDLAEIIGNDRPIAIPPPPPPKYSEIKQIALVTVPVTVQAAVTAGLSGLGVPMPLSAGIGAGLSNLAGQATAWGLGMQAPDHKGIDWGIVATAAEEGYLFSPSGPLGRLGVVSREVWQQSTSGFAGWTRGPGLNWSGIGGSVFNVGTEWLSHRLGGPTDADKISHPLLYGHLNVGVIDLINSAYNPNSGWAIHGSGKSPTVSMFEYAYGAVANMAVNWIQDQLERPSAPPKVSRPRSVNELPQELLDKFDEIDRQFDDELDRERIAAARRDRLQWQLRMDALKDAEQIPATIRERLQRQLGEGINNRAITEAALRQRLLKRETAERAERQRVARLQHQRKASLQAQQDAAVSTIARLIGPLVGVVAEQLAEKSPIYVEGKGFHQYDELFLAEKRHLVHLLSPAEFERQRKSAIARRDAYYTGSWTESDMELYRENPTKEVWDYITDRRWREYIDAEYMSYLHDENVKFEANNRLQDAASNVGQKIAWGTLAVIGAGVLAPTYIESGAVGVLTSLGKTAAGSIVAGALTSSGGPDGGFGTVASLLGGFVGGALGGSGPSVQSLLRAERAARAEYDAARLARQAYDLEMSKGVQIAEGVTLFKRMPLEALAAKPGYISPMVDAASEPTALALTRDVPISGGVPAIPGRDFYGPSEVLSYEASAAPKIADFFEPRTRLVANISEGSGGFAGGTLTEADAMNFTHVARGSAGQRGIGVIYIRPRAFSAAQMDRIISAVKDMDWQAGMTGGLVRTRPTVQMKQIGASVQEVARRPSALGIRYPRGVEAAGHIPDMAAGGDPFGPIIGLPSKFNSSMGPQWTRYGVGFTFEGFSLLDDVTGEPIYASAALEHTPVNMPNR